MRTIQFETAVSGNDTLVPTKFERPEIRPSTKDIPKNIGEIPAVLDTRGWKFDREEANILVRKS
jgi:hypothetical protein